MYASCKGCAYITQILDFLEKKIEACGDFREAPEGHTLLSVQSYILQMQRTMRHDQRRT